MQTTDFHAETTWAAAWHGSKILCAQEFADLFSAREDPKALLPAAHPACVSGTLMGQVSFGIPGACQGAGNSKHLG